jgi:hypothetical protein
MMRVFLRSQLTRLYMTTNIVFVVILFLHLYWKIWLFHSYVGIHIILNTPPIPPDKSALTERREARRTARN